MIKIGVLGRTMSPGRTYGEEAVSVRAWEYAIVPPCEIVITSTMSSKMCLHAQRFLRPGHERHSVV